VIFIGELRDKVTAETAFHLCKTGHLVFATLHASKATMVPQMLYHDYGISIDEIADNLILATNQVLVKRLCPRCSSKKLFEQNPEWFSLLSYYNKDDALKKLQGHEIRVPASGGSATCSCTIKFANSTISTGYSGRTVLAECVKFEPHMFEDNNISVMSMDKKTAASGNILDDAVEKILAGMVDVKALWRLV
jgi:type II secretory ATPase GspE/PulE/Tfp pilus assembly ATPase PilB-like protein